jgi:Fe-S cluster assembly protein SufD
MSTLTAIERPALELKLLENVVIPPLAEELRMEAMDIFVKKGFPHKKLEEWRYTDISPILKKDWKLSSEVSAIDQVSVNSHLIPGLEANVMVFVNGHFDAERSILIENDPDIIIAPFSRADEHLLSEHFGKYIDLGKHTAAALNTAMAAEGLFVYIPEGKELSAAIHAMYFHTGDNLFVQYRNLVIAGKHSRAEIIEGTYGKEGEIFSNIVTEISAGEDAAVNYYRIQEENEKSAQINMTQLHQQRGSICNTFTFNLGGKLIRNNLNYTLAGRQCEAHLYGLYIPSGDEHFDNHTYVDHAMPDCFSNELYKGIMNDRSVAVFSGKIIVRPDAQKTNAYQSNKNILLSPDARVDTKPQLEIFADDVKCSHGATVGQLNEEAIFYLRSRGIGEHAARTMLTFAFANETLDTLNIPPLKEFISGKIQEKLSAKL